MTTRFLVLGLAAALVLTGCGRKPSERLSEKLAEKMIEKSLAKEGGGKAEVNLGEGTMKIKTKDGEFSMASGKGTKVPADFPKDVLVYDGATVEVAMRTDKGQTVSLRTKDNLEKVMQTYKDKMTAQGWTEESSMTMGQQAVLAYKKDENRNANVIIVRPDSGDTQITLAVVTEK